MIYLDQENGRLTTPAIKSRQNRLHSAAVTDQCLRTPLTGKAHVGAPLQSSRKALRVINKVVATTGLSNKAEEKTKPAEAKHKVPISTGEMYPEIEKFFPYNQSEFETSPVPEEVYLSRFSLASLTKQPWLTVSPVNELLVEPCLPLSPFKMPKAVEYVDEMEAFLQTINELTVDLPPECEF